MEIKYLRFTSPNLLIIEFNDSNHPHYEAKLVSYGQQGFTVGSSDHAKTEILNFDRLNFSDNNEIIGTWTDINVDYPNAVYIRYYAALMIHSSIYLFGGVIDGYPSDRVVSFNNNTYNQVGKLNQRRYGHEVIQITNIVYLLGGVGAKQTEKWDLDKNETTQMGGVLDDFRWYPLLYSVHPDQCSSCSKNCDNGYCIMVDGNEHCKCNGGYVNLNNDPLEPCLDIDECESFSCEEGVCQNNNGSYSCICNEGFVNAWSYQSAICGKLDPFNSNLILIIS